MPATTGGLATTRENLFYLGWTKQAAWGTPLAPTFNWRWLDGSDANPEAKFAEEREGDTSPHISLMYKTSQVWGIKVVEYVRPITIGCALEALLGSGSDTYTAPTQATTLNAGVTAGASTFTTVGSIGNTSTGYFNFTPGFASAVYEVLNVNLASRTGSGPYTYTLVAGYTFAYAHNSADVVNNASTHVFTRQTGPFDAYTIETAFGSSSYGVFDVFRIQDCVCTDLTLESAAPNKAIKATHTWYGAPATIKSALSAISQEGTSIVGSAGGPLTHAMGAWTVDGSNAATTNAATIKSFKLQLKNSTGPDELLTEGIYAPYYMPGNFDITGDMQVAFQNYAQYLETYFGSRTAAAGALDAPLVGYGSFLATWAASNLPNPSTLVPDGLNSLAVNMPNVGYKAAKLTPKLDGKPLMQDIQFRAVKSVANPTPITLTLSNSQNSQY